MKVSRIAITLLGAALLCSASVFAAETKGTLNLDENVTVDGTPVKAGHYKVQWDGNGPDVQVTIVKGKDTVATFPARVAEQPTPTYANAYGSTEQPNGGRALTAIYFGGKHYSLEIQPNAAQQSSQQTTPTPSK